MSFSSSRVALRIAGREAGRAKGRSLLVALLIGLPILALAGADVVYRTWQLSPTEQVARTIGSADASVLWYGGRVDQSPSADTTQETGAGTQTPPTTAQLLAALPPGSRAIDNRFDAGPARIQTPAGITDTALVPFDYADPMARGLVNQVSGRAPQTAGEVALTTSLVRITGLRVGDMMHTVDPVADRRVVGIVTDAGHRFSQEAYTTPPATSTTTNWLIDAPAPVTWTQVRTLNALGYVVYSRWVVLHPPDKSQISLSVQSSTNRTELFATATLVAGMALLEIVLLAGPAFAVGARRQRRDLALVAAAGGRPRDLRNIVLATGVVLGVGAGVASVVIGVGGAAIAIPILSRSVDKVPGPFDLRPLDLLALVAVGILTAVAAAIVPARAAARLDIVATLAGRRDVAPPRKRVPIIGVAIVALGACVALGALSASTSAFVILAGVALSEVGLIICTPTLLGWAAHLGRMLPVPGRIALRDASRNRSSAAPAVAAVMASVIGAVAVVLCITSVNDQDRRAYLPSLPNNGAVVTLDPQGGVSPVKVLAVVRANLPTRSVVVVDRIADACALPSPTGRSCTSIVVIPKLPANDTSRWHGGAFDNVVVDDGSALPTLLGVAAPAAVAALRAGKAVALDSEAVHDGRMTLTLTSTTEESVGQDPPPTPPDRTVEVAAVAFTGGFPATSVILPPSLARNLGLPVAPNAVLAAETRAPSSHELQVTRAALQAIGSNDVSVETGYHNPSIWLLYLFIAVAALIAIGAAIIATALANADSRPDLTTLAAIGASPRTRRLLSLSRAAVIAGIGTVLGVVAGFLPAVAWIDAQHRIATSGVLGGGYVVYSESAAAPALKLVIPWLPILVTVAAIPVLAAMIAGLTTRSRLPSERRAE